MSDEDIVVAVDMTPRVTVPTGLYKARISSVGTKMVNAKDGSEVPYISVKIKLNDAKAGEANGKEIEYSIPSRVSHRSKLAALLQKAGTKLEGRKDISVKKELEGREVEVYMAPSSFIGRDGKNIDTTRIGDINFLGAKK